MYINIGNIFRQAQLCTNDYFSPNPFSTKGDNFLFICYFTRTTDKVELPLCLSSRDELLGILISIF